MSRRLTLSSRKEKGYGNASPAFDFTLFSFWSSPTDDPASPTGGVSVDEPTTVVSQRPALHE
jgi:hypothetical protein